ncbi:hypothetical protein FGO68_gene237 [Halteria grandinella]|uniref:C2H2-type domain-containing protein n=1 Tax=Halteria grandinella TaxID=5974 RepID=A0A8J8P1A4_HALGN|nr:hypothetical protein FGO68_gene237 [Halteria grandinella]
MLGNEQNKSQSWIQASAFTQGLVEQSSANFNIQRPQTGITNLADHTRVGNHQYYNASLAPQLQNFPTLDPVSGTKMSTIHHKTEKQNEQLNSNLTSLEASNFKNSLPIQVLATLPQIKLAAQDRLDEKFNQLKSFGVQGNFPLGQSQDQLCPKMETAQDKFHHLLNKSKQVQISTPVGAKLADQGLNFQNGTISATNQNFQQICLHHNPKFDDHRNISSHNLSLKVDLLKLQFVRPIIEKSNQFNGVAQSGRRQDEINIFSKQNQLIKQDIQFHPQNHYIDNTPEGVLNRGNAYLNRNIEAQKLLQPKQLDENTTIFIQGQTNLISPKYDDQLIKEQQMQNFLPQPIKFAANLSLSHNQGDRFRPFGNYEETSKKTVKFTQFAVNLEEDQPNVGYLKNVVQCGSKRLYKKRKLFEYRDKLHQAVTYAHSKYDSHQSSDLQNQTSQSKSITDSKKKRDFKRRTNFDPSDPLEAQKNKILLRLGLPFTTQIDVQQGADVDLAQYEVNTPVPKLRDFLHVRYLREDRQRWSTALVCEYELIDQRCKCDKIFKKWHNLFDHMRIHAHEKPFQCQESGCGFSFTQKSNLNKHMIIHSRPSHPYIKSIIKTSLIKNPIKLQDQSRDKIA